MLIVNIFNISWKKKYSREEIVAGAKLSPATVTKLLHTRRQDFKLSTIERIAKFFGCNAKDLLVEVPDEE